MTKNVPPPPDSAHESSSLFSLSSLEQMASGKHESIRIPSEDEGSGLLDIHALTEAAAHGNRVVPRPTPMPALLKAPNVPTPAAGMPMRVKVALGVMAVTIFALGGATLYLAKRPGAEVAVQAEPAPELAVPGAAAPVEPPQMAVVAPTTVVRKDALAEVAAPAAAEEPKHHARSGHAARETAPAAKPVVAAPAPQEPAKAPTDRSINNLLDQALTPGVKPARPAPMAAGSATPSRTDVLEAMQAVTAKVRACGGTGMAVVRITLSGRTGHVTDAVVDGQSDAKARACIMREVSRAKLAPFTNASFSVTYPFKL